MKRTLARALMVVSAAALITACGQKADETNVAQQPDANPTATIPTPANEAAAPDFVMKAAMSDMYEIEAAKVALARSTNADVKKFAQMMVDDHTKSTNNLKAAIGASGLSLTPPAALDEAHMKRVQDLKDKAAADFDKAYLDDQVDAHQGALDLMQRYANDGDNASLKGFAATTAPVVQGHYDHAKEMRDAMK
jgi:putative membrane protein